ncbi:MAG: hypothetical protein RMJ87_10460 [Cytophagales bacterium]|nr:hypothetical protein [Bernardetiaceae bacterium]MDW8205442.1 hypothetical protein [Cytophagales bacterium]
MLLLFKTVLYLRILAIGRGLLEVGWWRLLLLVALIIWAVFRLVAFQNPHAWLLAMAIIITGLHASRNDRFFLQTLTPHWAWLMRTEYLLLSLPFCIGMTAEAYWQGLLAWLILIGVLPYIQVFALLKWEQLHLLSWLPAHMYEWKAGLRKHGWIVLAIWILAALFYWAFVVQVALWLFYLIIVGYFYFVCEPRIWLELQGAMQARRFLWRKIKYACIAALIGAAPFGLLILFCHPLQAGFILLGMLLTGAYMSYAVLSKYALYAEARSLEPFIVHHFIFVGSCIVPVLLPVAAYFWWSNYGKAHRNLAALLSHA